MSPTLIEAARSGGAVPYVRVRLSDRDAGVPRFRFARWYGGTEPDGPSGIAMPADGSLVRARIDPATGVLYLQRIEMPSAASDYGAWTSLATVEVGAGLALHAAGARALLACYDGGAVLVRESTDHGATFGGATTLVFVGDVTAVACAIREDGEAFVAWATGGAVYIATRPASGAWGSPTPWPHTLVSVNGLTAADAEDWAVLVSGEDATGRPGCWSTRYGSGVGAPPGSWSALAAVATASPGLDVSYRASALAYAGAPRAVLVESYAGTGAFDRVMLTTGLAGSEIGAGEWRAPVAFEHESPWGLALAADGGVAFLGGPSDLWQAPAMAPPVDVTEAVLAVRYEGSYESERLSVVLDASLPGGPDAIVPGAEVEFSPGYLTDAGLEAAAGRVLSLTSIARSRQDGRSTVEVEAAGAFDRLARSRPTGDIAWPAGERTIAGIASEIAAGAGLRLALDEASTASTTLTPGFTIRAGESRHAALTRLLDRVPDRIQARGDELLLREFDPEELSGYGYGSAHPVRSVATTETRAAPSAVRVLGSGAIGEAVADSWTERTAPAIVVDAGVVTESEADDRAVAALRWAELSREAGVIEALPHPGQEPGDVIELTDATLGLDAVRYRVASVRFDFSRRPRGRYLMRLGLGAP